MSRTAAFLAYLPLLAAPAQAHDWDLAVPDSHAPIGVMGATLTMPASSCCLTVRATPAIPPTIRRIQTYSPVQIYSNEGDIRNVPYISSPEM